MRAQGRIDMTIALPSPEMALVRTKCAEIAAGLPDRYGLPIVAAREQLLAERRWWQDDAPPMNSDETVGIDSNGRAIGLRRLVAANLTDVRRANQLVIIYLHGGGWCVGSNATHESILRRLAFQSRHPVVGVDYSLAPEFPFPAGQDDVGAAIDSVLKRLPSGQAYVLAGDSAGANLALVEALRRRDRRAPAPLALLLFYGVFGRVRETGSMRQYGDGAYGLSRPVLQRYQSLYLDLAPGAEPPEPCEAFPLEADLRGLPGIALVSAELDPLADDSRALHRRLRDARVPVDLHEMRGLTHGFLSYGRMLPAVDDAITLALGVLST